jgi:hypothetical protein
MEKPWKEKEIHKQIPENNSMICRYNLPKNLKGKYEEQIFLWYLLKTIYKK